MKQILNKQASHLTVLPTDVSKIYTAVIDSPLLKLHFHIFKVDSREENHRGQHLPVVSWMRKRRISPSCVVPRAALGMGSSLDGLHPSDCSDHRGTSHWLHSREISAQRCHPLINQRAKRWACPLPPLTPRFTSSLSSQTSIFFYLPLEKKLKSPSFSFALLMTC